MEKNKTKLNGNGVGQVIHFSGHRCSIYLSSVHTDFLVSVPMESGNDVFHWESMIHLLIFQKSVLSVTFGNTIGKIVRVEWKPMF